jgi:diaminopimelate epimerase
MSVERSSHGRLREMLPRGRPFLKMHGLRNHFIIVDARDEPWRPGAAEAVRLCDQQVGVGADQIVVIEMPTDAGAAEGALAFARFWNVDGREAEACGNATRCVAWLLLEEQSSDAVTLETRAGILQCRRVGPQTVSTSMGRISMHWADIPLAEKRDTCHLDLQYGPLQNPVALNIANPHLVFFVDDVEEIALDKLAPAIQDDPLFPESVNVGIAQLVTDSRMRLKVYERGAGLTMACGSGACVAVFAALARGLTDSRRMSVQLPGGELDIEILADGSAVMTGPVAFCFSGYLPRS